MKAKNMRYIEDKKTSAIKRNKDLRVPLKEYLSMVYQGKIMKQKHTRNKHFTPYGKKRKLSCGQGNCKTNEEAKKKIKLWIEKLRDKKKAKKENKVMDWKIVKQKRGKKEKKVVD